MKRKLINSFIILSASSTISKIFSILNRMLLSRLLPLEAMSLYLVIMPTLSLCLTLGQVGIPSAVFRLILHPKYKNYKVIITAIILSFFSVIVICGTLFILSPFIAHSLLKNDYTLYPILSFLIFIPLIAISGIIKNYYLAKGHVYVIAKSQIVEETSRLLFTYLFLKTHFLFLSFFQILWNCFCIYAFKSLFTLLQKKQLFLAITTNKGYINVKKC